MSGLRLVAVACCVVALAVVAGCLAPERAMVISADEDGTVRVRSGGVSLGKHTRLSCVGTHAWKRGRW